MNTSTCTAVKSLARIPACPASRRGRATLAERAGGCASSSSRATAELLDELGDAARLSIRAITRRAGVSPTAFYLHFDDLEAIVSAAVEAGFTAFNGALLAAARGEDDPLASLAATSHAYLAFAERQPALYAVLFSARRALEHQGMPSPTGDGHDQGFAGLVALLRRADPALDEPEAVQLAVAVWSSLHGFAMLRAARPQLGWPSADATCAACSQRTCRGRSDCLLGGDGAAAGSGGPALGLPSTVVSEEARGERRRESIATAPEREGTTPR